MLVWPSHCLLAPALSACSPPGFAVCHPTATTCAALLPSPPAVSALGAEHSWVGMCYPLLITASGIIVCMLTTLIATDLKPARVVSEIENTLKGQLIISTLAMTPVRVGRMP